MFFEASDSDLNFRPEALDGFEDRQSVGEQLYIWFKFGIDKIFRELMGKFVAMCIDRVEPVGLL